MPGESERKADPELRAQLARAALAARPADAAASVEAVVRLKPSAASGAEPSPDETEAATRALLQRVEARTGCRAHGWTVFRNLACFAVAAEAPFIRELLADPEVESAVANRRARSHDSET